MTAFSKQLVRDIRILLWVVTVGGLALAAYCICVFAWAITGPCHG